MTTATAEPPVASLLVESRPVIKKGVPTDGLMILVGHTKSGKTVFSASFPNSYVLELEKGRGDRVPGRIHDIAMGADRAGVNGLDLLRQVLPQVLGNPDIKTVVIDTVDVLIEWISDEIARSKGLSSISERKAGVNGYELWGELFKRVEGMTDYLKSSGKLIILTAHCKAPEKDGEGTVIVPAGLNVPGKSGPYLASQADVIGYTYKKPMGSTTKYFVSFQGGPLAIWGTSIEEIADKTVELDKASPYRSFAAEFGVKESEPEQKKNGRKK